MLLRLVKEHPVEGFDIGLDLLIVLVTAIAGGMLARLLRLPIIPGYLVGGIAIGPYGFGLVHDVEKIDSLATIGVVLLLFTIGLEFSLKEIMRMGKVSLLGGAAQIVLTAAVGLVLGKFVGLCMVGAVFFGLIIALSSTMVVLKLLMERGEIDTTHGRIMLGILLVQDLSVVPMMVIMSAVGGEMGTIWVSLGAAVLKAVIFLGVMLALGIWGLPWFLRKVAGQRSRELFFVDGHCPVSGGSLRHLSIWPVGGFRRFCSGTFNKSVRLCPAGFCRYSPPA
ncbi:cation:proton antiporter [Chloroflexota bacterium]